jgi:hypothetical protein
MLLRPDDVLVIPSRPAVFGDGSDEAIQDGQDANASLNRTQTW